MRAHNQVFRPVFGGHWVFVMVTTSRRPWVTTSFCSAVAAAPISAVVSISSGSRAGDLSERLHQAVASCLHDPPATSNSGPAPLRQSPASRASEPVQLGSAWIAGSPDQQVSGTLETPDKRRGIVKERYAGEFYTVEAVKTTRAGIRLSVDDVCFLVAALFWTESSV